MRTAMAEKILWSGRHLDGVLTITGEEFCYAPFHPIYFVLISDDKQIEFVGKGYVDDTPKSLEILRAAITRDYLECVMEDRNANQTYIH